MRNAFLGKVRLSQGKIIFRLKVIKINNRGGIYKGAPSLSLIGELKMKLMKQTKTNEDKVLRK